jgi:PKD repeat protein
MTFDARLGRLALLAGMWATLGSCSDTFSPGDPAVAPDSVAAKALGQHSVQVTWARAPDAAGYVIERRANLSGPFVSVKQISSGFVTQLIDDSLAPETIYGYRMITVSLTGQRSAPSLVTVARTAPVPGIVATVATTPPELASRNGYSVAVAGNGDSVSAPLAPQDQHRFSPLPPGVYRVTLSGVTTNCSVSPESQRTDTVTDQGLSTLRYASFSVSCRDPHVGRLAVHVTTTGDSLDADGYVLTLSGIADDTTLSDSARAYFKTDTVPVQALRQFEALRPGGYTLQLSGLAGNCALQGPASQDVRVNALDDLSRSFAVTCQATPDPTRPLVWRSVWSGPTASSGERVSLQVGLDLRAKPGQDVNAVQADLFYDPAVVRYDSAVAQSPWQKNTNAATPGTITWLAFVNGPGLTDSVSFIRFYFTVIGDAGATTTTRSTIKVADAFDGSDLRPLIRRVEGTLVVGPGSANQAPVARPGGPYSGSAGAPIGFNGGGSSDPDGSVASYNWNFGDGESASGVAPAHTYAATGTYTVTLTVTDNGGLTGSAQTTASVTTGGGNQPPIAVANGPYSGVVGAAVSFSAAGSTDPDGTIATYGWEFGDGGSASGPTPTHTYGSAGSFTVRLTVTDNLGATGSATATATITTAGGTKPFTWRSDFGPVNPADSLVTLTITLDLSTDIPETPGPEALDSWRVDSLTWNSAVLRYFAFNFGSGSAGSVNPTDAARGKLLFNGVQGSANNSGLLTIATIRFKAVGGPGSATSTRTALGPLLGTAATGSFSYGAFTAVQEGSLTVP